MNRPYLEESQRLKDSQWMWVFMIITAAGAIIPLGYGLYWQVGQGEVWGDEPMPDEALIGLFIFILICMVIMFVCMAYTKLELKIDDDGVHYRFVPYKFKWALISKEEINTYEIKKPSSFLGMCSIGYHKNLMNNSRSMNVHGSKFLSLMLKNKRKILIGTQNPEGAEMAMRKLFNSNDMF